MKKRPLSILFVIALTTSVFSAIPANAAGRSATSIPNTILNGKGAPTLAIGLNGDFYIDTRSLLIYGPKKNGKWPVPQNLQGPTGAAGTNGADGKNGNDGKNGSDGKTVATLQQQVVLQVLLVRKERKEQQVQLALLVQQGHKVQPVQRELRDHLEVEVEHLDHKVQRGLLAQLVQLVLQELQVQLEQLVRQVLQVQLVRQVRQEQRVQQVLLVLLKLFMERSQFQISTEWLALRRMEQLMDSRQLKVMWLGCSSGPINQMTQMKT
jgi:hypothetical protein